MNRYLFVLLIFLPVLLFAEIDSKTKSNHAEEIDLLLRMARESLPQTIDKAYEYARKAQALALQSDLRSKQINALLILADISQEQGDYIGSFKKYQEALETAEKNKLSTAIIDSYIGLADFFAEIGDVDEAIKFLLKALDESILINDDHRKGLAQAELGQSYRQKQEYELSNRYAAAAIEVFKAENNTEDLTTCYILQGKNYLDLGDYEMAFEIDEKVLELTRNNIFPRKRSIAFNDLAWNYFKQGDLKKALEYNLKALKLRQESGLVYLEVSAFINIAVLFMEWQRYEDAYDFFSRAQDRFRNIDTFAMQKMKLRYFQKLSELNLLTNDTRAALDNFKNFHQLKQELDNISNNIELNKIRTQFQVERYSKEKTNLNRLQQIEINRQRIALIAVLIITFLAVFSGFFLYTKYRENKKLSEELTRTNFKLQAVNEENLKEIAEKKRMEKIINTNADHLKLINRILRHDITNDLVTIKSGLSVYKANGDKAILDELSKRVEKSVNLIHSMREFEEFINVHTGLKVIDPVKVINNIADNYKSIKINLSGKCLIMAEDSISSALENLIRNAVDHGGVEEVDITIQEIGKNCRIVIADQGLGVPEKIKAQIFKEGFQYGSSGNTGIGLFIAKQTIESFGGTLELEDNEPQGSRFVIRLRKAI